MGGKRDVIEIYRDNRFLMTTDDPTSIRETFYGWFMKTPFWESTSMKICYYKDIENNEDYKHRNDPPIIISEEKNLFFMADNNPYVCLRCGRPSEIVGFCGICYHELYGLTMREEFEMPIEEIQCHPRFIEVVEADPVYTQKVMDSMKKEGMKNPIVIDGRNRILIGHHRYFCAKKLEWKTMRCKRNEIDFNHGYFYEGKGSNCFIVRVDGSLFMNTTRIDDIMPRLLEFHRREDVKTIIIEAFLNVGTDIRLRNVFIPERGDVVDPTWLAWYIRKFNKKPRIGKFS